MIIDDIIGANSKVVKGSVTSNATDEGWRLRQISMNVMSQYKNVKLHNDK